MRWQGYDYALAGAYVVTNVTRERRYLLGAIREEVMILNAAGTIVQDTWFNLPERFPTITLDAFVVMPNHIHGIIILNEATEMDRRFSELGRASPAPTNRENQPCSGDREVGKGDGQSRATVGAGLALPSQPTAAFPPRKPTLGNIVGAYKSLSAIAANGALGTTGQSFWQRGYHDRVIRDRDEHDQFCWYIEQNPATWIRDREYAAS